MKQNSTSRNKRFYVLKTVLILLSALLVFVTGCSAGDKGGASHTAEGTGSAGATGDKQVVVAVASDPGIDQLDAGTYKGSIQVHPMIYDSLVEYGEKGEILSSLAESWTISPDGKEYTFKLRKDVKFSDGTEFNAAAVKFSFERWYKDPTNSSINVAKALQEITAVDAHTVKMTFSQAFYPFLTELTYARPVRILSPSAVEPAGDVKGKFVKPIGTGAWKVESYTKDQQAVLVRNPNYWGKAPLLNKIVLKVVNDPQSRLLALQNGSVDISGGQMGKIAPESIQVAQKSDSLTVQSAPGSNSHFVVFNGSNPFLQDVNVRKAINLAVNKKSIVDKLMGGMGKEAQGLFPATVPYVTADNIRWYGYEPEQAKQLLKEAGFADTNGDGIVEKNGKPLELNFVLQQTEFPEWKSIAEFVQSQLKEIGINVNLKVLESNAYYDALWKNKQYDMLIYRTYADSQNPHFFLLSLFHRTGNAPAVAWADPQLEALIDEAMGATDTKARQDKYDALFGRMFQQAMVLPVYYPDDIFVVNNRVKGFKLGQTAYLPVVWNELDVK
ncbi:nickel ABC transporter substrate-binding protein [Paenibacillus tyrfis]|uniref:Nickel ABC transporter substrate-binding protein n=1 Tax=Paenibacillus tyrfis TaxID=1501230 RepID=A0A081NTF9_9BACL|nr:nickel ABC transporter substrate-binding protein [Paenibacillus tyrfis]KEQ21732.1 nickel ABC transporter substrate-binding protein [Paenibacillus tyrfis]